MSDLESIMPFAIKCGIKITSATADEVTGTLDWAADLCTSHSMLHGGSLMTLADTLGGAVAFLNLPEGADTTTIESKTNFFRGVRSGTVHGRARPLHRGRTLTVVQTELTDDDGRNVAVVTQTQLVLTKV